VVATYFVMKREYRFQVHIPKSNLPRYNVCYIGSIASVGNILILYEPFYK